MNTAFVKSKRSVESDESGSAAVEFALLLPMFLMVIIGGMGLSMLGYSAAGLQFAAQSAARCASINTTICSSITNTQVYASQRFTNITGKTATLVASTQSCGNQVSGSVSFKINTGIYTINIPLTSVACFPT